MSFEHEEALADVLKRRPTDYHAELARRKQRRDAIAEHFNEKRADQAAAKRATAEREARELANYKARELTAADIRVFDDFNRMDANRNRDIVRDIRTDERRKEQCDALMARDLDLYYSSGIADNTPLFLASPQQNTKEVSHA